VLKVAKLQLCRAYSVLASGRSFRRDEPGDHGMGILLAFAPFIVFAAIDRLAGSTGGLVAGAVVALALLLRDRLTPGRRAKMLDIGTAILFAGLALYALLARPTWSVIGVRLCVDAGLLLIVLASLAARRPFTLQYAREQVPQSDWDNPEFIRANYVISGVWALAFAILIAAELALLLRPDLPRGVGMTVIVLALVGAVKFTGWYPERLRAAAAAGR
jgi:hypothetical protein